MASSIPREPAMDLEGGRLLVRAARSAVSEFLGVKHGTDAGFEDRFSVRCGVFVTINDREGLRGCIGYPMPERELGLAVKDAAVSAAARDPRFPPLRAEELNTVTFEVTVLSIPEKITVDSPSEYLDIIKVGRDGLIVSDGSRAGLLLPQVPVEYGWSEAEFLGQACQKAGLPSDAWMDPGVSVERFQGIIFEEEQPGGSIMERRWDLQG